MGRNEDDENQRGASLDIEACCLSGLGCPSFVPRLSWFSDVPSITRCGRTRASRVGCAVSRFRRRSDKPAITLSYPGFCAIE